MTQHKHPPNWKHAHPVTAEEALRLQQELVPKHLSDLQAAQRMAEVANATVLHACSKTEVSALKMQLRGWLVAQPPQPCEREA
jgi:hypothetical protein